MTTTQATAHALIQRWKEEGGMLESVLCLLITQALDEAQKSALEHLETVLRAVHYDMVLCPRDETPDPVADALEEVADRMEIQHFTLD